MLMSKANDVQSEVSIIAKYEVDLDSVLHFRDCFNPTEITDFNKHLI